MADPNVTGPLQLLDLLGTYLEHPDAAVVLAVERAIVQLFNHSDQDVRSQVVRILGLKGSSLALDVVDRGLRDRGLSVHEAAGAVLATWPLHEQLRFIDRALSGEHLREYFTTLLNPIANETTSEAATALLERAFEQLQNEDLRWAAVELLRGFRSKRAKSIVERARRDHDPRVKEVAARRVGPPRTSRRSRPNGAG